MHRVCLGKAKINERIYALNKQKLPRFGSMNKLAMYLAFSYYESGKTVKNFQGLARNRRLSSFSARYEIFLMFPVRNQCRVINGAF